MMRQETAQENEQAGQTPLGDLRRGALEHYERVSSVAHEWYAAIPKAIESYYADPERARLEREVVERAKADRCASKSGVDRNSYIDAMIKTRSALNAAIDALIQFESEQGNPTAEMSSISNHSNTGRRFKQTDLDQSK